MLILYIIEKTSDLLRRRRKMTLRYIMTNNYLAHIKIQCDTTGAYIPDGDIIFPTSWDTDEKRENAMLKSFKFINRQAIGD